MCGIIGRVNFNKYIDDDQVKEMQHALEKMVYRGPDNLGLWNAGNGILFGHRRLSIIDLSEHGNQPFHDAYYDLHIVFNGEIYNYQDLKQDLVSKGYSFNTQTDTEVLLKCYHCYGSKFLQMLRGMFAFVIYDPNNKKLFFARDRVGKKPLFIYTDGHKLIFSSEQKYLHAFKDVDLEVSPEQFQDFLVLQYVPSPRSIYKNVQQLPVGSFGELSLVDYSFTTNSYWDAIDYTSPNPQPISYEELDNLIKESVRYRLIADVDIGVLLSGGIDSSLLSAYAAEMMGSSLKAYCVGFNEEKYDETSYAETVARALGITLIKVKGSDVTPDVFEKCIFHADQPLADSAMVPTYMVSKALSEHVKVVLSGEGADELFHGYSYYRNEKLLLFLEQCFGSTASSKLLGLLSTGNQKKKNRIQKIYDFDKKIGVARWTSVFNKDLLSTIVSKDVKGSSHIEDDFARIYDKTFHKSKSRYTSSTMIDFMKWLPGDLLVKVDRMTMAHSVEARAPYLDQCLVERILNVPAYQKASFTKSKILLRNLLEKKLPSTVAGQIANRKKQGFEVPKANWLKNDLRDLAEMLFSKNNIKSIDYLDPEETRKLWDNFCSNNNENLDRSTWTLFSFLAWEKQHKDHFGFND